MKKISVTLVIMMILTSIFGAVSYAEGTPAALIDELTIYKGATINSMDYTVNTAAASFTVFGYTGEGLYKWAKDGSELILGLADSEEVSEDGLTRTYHIRENAYYSNGTQITAHDFEYSWKRLADPAVAAEYANMLQFAGIKNAAAVSAGEMPLDELGVKAVDDFTLVCELDTPVNFFGDLMTFATFFPLNQEFVEAAGDQFGLSVETTLCSGPYMLTDWTAGGTTETVTRNPYYYALEDLNVDKLTWQIITETSSGIMGYEQGTLDVMQITSEFVEQYQDNPGYNPLLVSTLWWMQPNCTVAPFDNMQARLAFAYAVDKEAICQSILKDGSVPAYFFYPLSFQAVTGHGNIREYAAELGYGEDGQGNYLMQDDEKAAELWNAYLETSYTKTFEITLIFTNTDTMNYIAAVLKQEIESVLTGVTLNLQPLESNDRIQRLHDGDFTLALAGWGADYKDCSNWAMLCTADSSFNYGKWVSVDGKYDELDKLYQTVDAADELARAKDLLDMESILLTEGGYLPLYQKVEAYLINTDYKVPLTANGGWLYQYTDLNK
ncbi:MAG: peptide ABC transporter substrate-binding protein [Clostridia bacterium]|nr:peptide ABC transporter substrate-binding protein [Clostridia bacterium]